jgi:hypothetical protein
MKTIIIPAGTPMWAEGTPAAHSRMDAPVEIWTKAEEQAEVGHFRFERGGWAWVVRRQDVRVVATRSDGRPY